MEEEQDPGMPWWDGGAPGLVVRLSRAAGIAPLLFKTRRTTFSPILKLYGKILLIFMQTCGIWSVVVLLPHWTSLHKMTKIVWIMMRINLLIFNFYGMLFAADNMEKLLEIVRRVALIKIKLGEPVYSAATRRKELIIISLALLFISALFSTDYFVRTFEMLCESNYSNLQEAHNGTAVPNVFVLLPFKLLFMVEILIEAQLLLTLWFLSSLFPSIVRCLKEILRSIEKPDVKTLTDIVPHECRAIENSVNIPPTSINRAIDTLGFTALNEKYITVKPKETKQLTIHDINDVYVDVCELMTSANEYIGFPLVLVMCHCGMGLIGTPYNAINVLFSTPIVYSVLVVESLWCVFHLFRIYVFIAPGHLIVQENHQIYLIVSKLIAVKKIWGDEMATGLRSLWATLTLNKPEISPLGMFTFSRGLLVSILGAAMTYLVILIQFRSQDGE